ncbi:MAG: hypothetical protein JWP76_954 [Dactylosporangium sp.]|nr:hypothetical protein [Dactylosporangium sp.]
MRGGSGLCRLGRRRRWLAVHRLVAGDRGDDSAEIGGSSRRRQPDGPSSQQMHQSVAGPTFGDLGDAALARRLGALAADVLLLVSADALAAVIYQETA